MGKKSTYHDYLRQELGDLIEQLELPELYKQSLKRRWLDQVVWADKKAGECRQWHYRLRLTTIIGGVILPALVGINFQLGTDNVFFQTWFPYIPFTLSQIIAISAAVEEFCRFGDRWRDYRQMSEDLKAEGWQYLQLSGPYRSSGESSSSSRRVREVVRVLEEERSPEEKERENVEQTPTHLKGYATFANRIEHIIKKDVQNYITELVQQQAKQEAEIEKYLESAKSVAEDKSLFASRTPPNGGNGFANQPAGQPTAMGANIAPMGQQYVAGYPNGMAMAAPATPMNPPVQQPPMGMMGTAVAPPPVAPPPTGAPPPVAPPPTGAPPPVAPPPTAAPSPAAPLPTAASTPGGNLNSAILSATNSLRGMSSAAGPDGGNNACAWTLNKVLAEANIPALGENPNYVPSLLDALKQGRGQQVSKQESKAGDLVVAYGEAHVGVALTDGGDRVLSNSSSRAAFVWESDADFDGSYGGSSVIYRLIQ